jgi:hypothetical protein
MSKFGSRLALVFVLGVGSIGLVACGGGDDSSSSASAPGTGGAATSGGAPTSGGPVGDVPVETWAGGVCGAVNTWLAGINANGTKLNQDVQGISDLGAGRDLLVKFMQDAVTLTDTMISAVQAVGAPAVASGQQLSADLVQALSPVKQTFEGAVTKAQQLPTNDPQAFSQAASQLGTEITNSQGSFTASFDALQTKYNDPALNDAFKTVPACAKLGA